MLATDEGKHIQRENLEGIISVDIDRETADSELIGEHRSHINGPLNKLVGDDKWKQKINREEEVEGPST